MVKRILARAYIILVIAAMPLVCMTSGTYADTTDSTVYGGSNYGACDYGSCTITLSSSGSTAVDVIPTSAGKCTVHSNTATVLTDSTTGYSLSMTTSTTNNAMVGASTNISTSSGTSASPITLAMNTWGFRIDGLSGFGTGPTTSQSSGAVPGVSFAGIPASNQTPVQIASSSSPANPAVNTTVWYGLCANATLPAGTYTTTVTYTAVTN